MRIRLGYACISETLPVTSSSTYTYTRFCKENDFKKLDSIIRSNLFALRELLIYNIKNDIHFFRFSSNIIPLATKNEVSFDYFHEYSTLYNEIGNLIKTNDMRVDFHLSEFCVLNSVHKDVIKNSIDILEYHYNLLRFFLIKFKILVLHVGGCTFGKDKSITRFCNNFKKLNKNIQKCIAIENDDKIFTIEDCLKIHDMISVPIVFDYHHYLCNGSGSKLDDFIEKVFSSWNGEIPKMHFSSPKSRQKKERRSHHDYIDSDTFIDFIEKIKIYNQDVDIMIEAKKKDEALFRLVRELKYKTDYNFIDETTFIVENKISS